MRACVRDMNEMALCKTFVFKVNTNEMRVWSEVSCLNA